jgi:hypothetical protein
MTKQKFIYISIISVCEHKIKSLYAPLTSVDVERSFSHYKNLLTDRRHKLTNANIEKLIVIQLNSFLNSL